MYGGLEKLAGGPPSSSAIAVLDCLWLRGCLAGEVALGRRKERCRWLCASVVAHWNSADEAVLALCAA